ncbi:Outer membrane protein OprM [Achromobacter anxifer]|uniref:Protein CyaE n=1 Tax=Achromobacter anxifer TaxID=1287737 RepID=A0A6S7EQC8_9BURK|nr:TolC family protein [Achromobacter anxifer]CAB3921486.1 Outer membrane protein OprM [Achromobacter anxifer]
MNDSGGVEARRRGGIWSGCVVACVLWVCFTVAQAAPTWDVFNTEVGVPPAPASLMLAGQPGRDCASQVLADPLRLDQAVVLALCRNPATRKAWADVRARAAGAGVATAQYLPTVSINTQNIRQKSDTVVKDYPPLSSSRSGWTHNQSISLNWLLYDFGARGAALENAEALLGAALASQEVALQATFATVATDYYAAQAAKGKLAAAVEAEKIASDSFGAAVRRVEHGVASVADQLQAETAKVQATLRRVRAEAELRAAQGVLLAGMTLSPSQQVVLPDIEEGAMAGPAFQSSVDALMAEATERHPSVVAAKAQWNAAKAKEAQVAAEGLPKLSLTSRYGRNNQPVSSGFGANSFPAQGREFYIGVQLQIPLFEGFSRNYQIREAAAERQRQGEALAEVRQGVGLAVWKSYQALQASTENVRHSAELRSIAEKSFEAAKRRYVMGVGSMLELLSAQNALTDANQLRIEAVAEWRSARLQLAEKLGQLGMWQLDGG